MGCCRQRKGISTSSPIEHPSRKLQPAATTSSGQSAAKDDAVRTTDRLVDRHSKAKPRMPAIENFTELRPVGVLEYDCTIIGALMPRMVARRRSKYIEQGCRLTVRAYARPSTRQPWQRSERQFNPDRQAQTVA